MIRRRPVLRLAALGCALWLSACGQKGPLYLPDQGASPVRTTAEKSADGAKAAPDRGNEPRKQIH